MKMSDIVDCSNVIIARWILSVFLISPTALWAQPANDNLANAEPMPAGYGEVTGSNEGAWYEASEPYHAGNWGGASVWWSWTASESSGIAFSTAGSDFDTLLAVYTGDSYENLALVASNDDSEEGVTSRVAFRAEAGVTYLIAVDGYSYSGESTDTGNIVLSVSPFDVPDPPVNDDFENRIVLSGTEAQDLGSTLGATRQAGEPFHAGLNGANSVWWSWTAPMSGPFFVQTTGSDFDTLLGIYTGETVDSLTWVASNDDQQGSLTSYAAFNAEEGVTYQIAVDGAFGDAGEVVLSLGEYVRSLAPDWTLETPSGETLASGDFAGKVIILNFWATWCEPCTREIPDLISLYDAYKNEGLVVIGISVDRDGSGVVRQFMYNYGVGYPIVMSDYTVELDYGGIDSIPTTFFIDRTGRIADYVVGSQSETFFEDRIVPLLEETPEASLVIGVSGDELIIRWPTGGNWILQQCDSLAAPDWTDVDSPMTTEGDQTVARLSKPSTHRFYRLHWE